MEKREKITVDARAQHRLYVLQHVDAGRINAAEAARILRLSVRQVRRLQAGYRSEGLAALVHGNRGRAPGHRTPPELRERLVKLATEEYAGVNRAHLAELLAEREGIELPVRSLRRILAEGGVKPVRRRRPPRHRSRRERMAREGLLLQVDGSRHDWLEGRGPLLTLIGGIDDATGTVTGATFRLQEDAAGYFELFSQTARAYGLPAAVYSDRHGIFIKDRGRPPTLAEQLSGKLSFTQVGRALDQLNIGWIGAHSAPAKGRIERLWGTWQDRLITELRLAGVTTLEGANALLATFLPRHNQRFAVPAREPQAAWRALPAGLLPEMVFCFHYPRRVANDATIGWAGEPLALPRRRDGRSWAGRSVTLQERLDGSLWVSHEGKLYALRPAPPAPDSFARATCRVAPTVSPISSWSASPGPTESRRRDAGPGSRHPTTLGAVNLTVAGDIFTGRLRGRIHWPPTAQTRAARARGISRRRRNVGSSLLRKRAMRSPTFPPPRTPLSTPCFRRGCQRGCHIGPTPADGAPNGSVSRVKCWRAEWDSNPRHED
jgi:transposase